MNNFLSFHRVRSIWFKTVTITFEKNRHESIIRNHNLINKDLLIKLFFGKHLCWYFVCKLTLNSQIEFRHYTILPLWMLLCSNVKLELETFLGCKSKQLFFFFYLFIELGAQKIFVRVFMRF